MKSIELMTSGFISYDDNYKGDPYSNSTVERLMSDNASTSVALEQETALLVADAYEEIKEKDTQRIIEVDQKFMEQFYPGIKQERLIVNGKGDLSIEALFDHTEEVTFYMDSEGGAKHISEFMTASKGVDGSFKQVFLCEDAVSAKEVVERLESGDDSIFDDDLRVAWVNENTLVDPYSSNSLSVKYAVGTDESIYSVIDGQINEMEANTSDNLDMAFS